MRLRKSSWLLPLLVLSCVFLLTAAIPSIPTGTWQTWNPMADSRSGAAAVLLQDGRVLIIGGNDANGPVASADLFATDGSFSAAALMQTPRSGHTATVLSNGNVLVAGGTTTGGGAVNTAEIYNPTANSWTSASGTMVDARSGHAASLLPNGQVLLAGGQNSSGALNALEIFDPSSGTFSGAGVMTSARMNHAAASLQDGRVLIVGGWDGTTVPPQPPSTTGTPNALATSDIFDPSSGLVSAGPALNVARMSHSATTQLDGKVLVAGGNNGTTDLNSVESFDPSVGTFTLSTSSLATARSGHLAFLLPHSAGILIVGGTASGVALATSELYYPWTGAFNINFTAAMASARGQATGSPLSNGTPLSQNDGVFLVAGGANATGTPLASTELYGFATIKTDRTEYAPGQTVNITGSGWVAGETVTLTLVESPQVETIPPFTAVADSNGNISNSQYSPNQHDLNVTYTLTAVGSVSQAQTTFADAKNLVITFAGTGAGSVAVKDTTTPADNLTCTGNPCNVAMGNNDVGTLTATANSGSTFAGWSSASSGVSCSGTTSPCNFSLGNSAQSVTATFNLNNLAITSVNGGSNPAAGTPFSVVVQAQNGSGSALNVTANTNVTLSLDAGTGTLGGTLTGTITAGNSSVTISSVTYTKAQSGVVLTATETSGNTLAPGNSAAFTVNPGAASKLVFTTQPSGGTAGTAFGTQPVITIEDANGNTANSSASVTLAIGNNPSSGTLNGTTTVSAVNGVATFSGLSINNAGTGYTLTASSSSLTGATSSPFNMTARAMTVTAATNTKTYDGTTSAAATPTITSGTLAPGDTANFTEVYSSKNVGTGLTLTPSGTVTNGANNVTSNYTITFVNNTGVINGRALTVTAATNTKTYDGTTSAAATPSITSGAVQGTDTANFTEVYSNKNVGTGKTLTPSGTVSDGNGGANYSYTFVSNTTGVISAEALTVTAATNSKGYDGTTSAAATPTITSGAVQTGDTANFTEAYSSKNVGTGLTLTPSGTVSDGNGGNNYTYTFVTNTTGVITARAITVTAATNTKTYDATTSAAAVPSITSGTLATGDTAGFTEAYSTKNVGTGLTLTPSGSVSDGNSGNNYAVTFANNTTGVINARALTVTATTNTKTYDGTTSAAATPTVTSGALQGTDTASFAEAYSTKNAGTGLNLTPSGSVSDGNNGNNYTVTFTSNTTGVINKRALTVTAATNTKTYDGTTSAAATPSITSGALQGTDTANFTEVYSNKNVGTGLTLTPSGSVSDGNSGNNYAVTFVNNTTGVITARPITVTAATNSKPYDGTTSAAATPTITGGSLATGDTASFTEAYSSKNVGTGLTLTLSGSVGDGNSGNNYAVTFVNNTTGVITARAITVTAATNTKTYDATTNAAAAPTITSGSLATGDTASFTEAYASKSVGTGLTLTPSGSVSDGNSGNNYAVTFANNTTGVITARTLTVTGITANNKTYDTTTAATLNIGSAALVGVVTGDTVTLNTAAAAGTFASANVGTGITVTVSGLTITGTDAGNYSLSQPTTTANITQATPTVTVTGGTFTYDTFAHAATATATGVGGATVTGSFAFTYTPPGNSTTPTNAGNYSVTANFASADPNYSNTSGSGSIVITKANASFNTPMTAPTAVPYGTATVSLPPSTSTGIMVNVPGGRASSPDTVKITVGTLAPVTATFNGSSGTFGPVSINISTLAPGPYTISYAYSGNANVNGFTDITTSLTVNQASTTTTLTSSATPSTSGQSVTFTATVADSSTGSTGTATGTVTFKDNGTTIGTGTLNASGVATFTTSSLSVGSHPITAVYGGDTNFTGSTSGTLTQVVLLPPSISKAFGAANIPVGGTTTLTFTITNPTANTAALTGLAFSDPFPSGLAVASTPNVTDNCSGTFAAAAGATSVSLTGGTIATSASCTISVSVTGTTSGVKNNTTGAISSTNGGTGNVATASINVDAPPAISKAFGASSILLNASTSLTFTITNPNTTSLSGVSFNDNLPAGVVVANPAGLTGGPCGSGTISATPGSSLVALSGGTLAGSGQCVFSVNVTGTTTGTKLNTTGAISATESGTGAVSNTASLNVTGTPPTITSANSATFTAGIANSLTVTTSGTPTPSLSDTGSLPSGVTFADNGNGTATIAGTASVAGTYTIAITAQNGITPNATQTFTLSVVAGSPASITAFSGSGQSTTVGMAFGSPLVALVQDAFSNPVSGATVMFAAPGSGPGGNFGGNPGFTTTTNANGQASAAFTANTVAGTYSVIASVSGVSTPASFVLRNVAGPVATLALNPPTASITAGRSQNYTAEGLDVYGNPTGDVTASTTFTISPDGSCTSGGDPASCATNVADSSGSSHTVLGTYSGTGARGIASLTVNAGTFTQLQLLVPGETAAPGTTSGKMGTPNIEYVNGAFSVTVNAVDQYWNLVNTVTDTVEITSTDAKAVLPANAALVAGTGTFSTTLETAENPAATTITAADYTDSTKTSDTSPAIEVIVVYTASISPTDWATGQQATYTLTVSNAPSPNANNLASVEIAVPSADQGTIANVSETATQPGGATANWSYDPSLLPGIMRFFENTTNDAVTPGGTITITFAATSNAAVTNLPVLEVWNTTAFSDAASTSAFPLAWTDPTKPGSEPTVNIGAAPKITSASSTNAFTYGTAGNTFTVTATGVPTPSLSESGWFPSWATFKDNGDGTATISGTPTTAGTSTFSITAHNGYGNDATQSFTLTVNTVTLTVMIVGTPSRTYDGTTTATLTPANFSISGLVGTDSLTVTQTVGAYNSPNVASATTVTASLASGNFTPVGTSSASNYVLPTTASGPGHITAAPITVTANPQTKVYGTGLDHALTYTVTGGALVSGDSFTGYLTRAPGETVGTYAINQGTLSISDIGNYNLSYVGANLTITAAPITVTANAQTKVYGTADPTLTYSVTSGALVTTIKGVATGDAFTGALSRASGSNVGSYAITQGTLSISDIGNYNLTYVGANLTITAAPITVTANPQTKVYGTADPTLTYSVTSGALVSGDSFTGALSRASGSNVGSYAITQGTLSISDIGNYNLTYVGANLTITAAPITVTANPQTKVYGTADPTLTYSVTSGALVSGDSFTGALSRASGSNVGSYAITQGTLSISDIGNYNLTYVGANLTITAATLTITASSGSMIYGGPVFPVTPIYTAGPPSGFVNGDTSASLTTQPTCGTTATSLSPVSGNLYVSTCWGAADNNYSITYASGTVTVNPATTTTAVTSSVNPSTYMQLVTFTATVTPQFSGTPTGTVIFKDTVNGTTTTLGTFTLTTLSGGVATFSTTSLQDAYSNSITAVYSGDGNFITSTSPAITQTVNPAPNLSLNPLSVSFGNQNVNTTSSGIKITLSNVGDAALTPITIQLSDTVDFTETNNCPNSLGYTAPNNYCTITVTFKPADTGVIDAVLTITSNDDDAMNAQDTVSLTGAGLSTITGGSLYTDALFATANGCGSIAGSGNGSVDSFNSAQGYSSSHQLSGGNVGTNGNVSLSGNSTIYGSAAVDSTLTGNCSKTSLTGVTTSGGAKVTGGLVALNGPITYPAPPTPNPAPPTTSQNISGSCGTISGCTNDTGSKTITLAPGQYGNVQLSGGTTAHVSKGTYNINSLTLSGNSILYVDSGPVIVNLAGASLSGGNPAMDLTGGSIVNPTGIPANLQFTYAGSQGVNLSGGSESYATVYAPNAVVNFSGNSDFFGSIIGSTLTDSGNAAIHYDTSLPSIQAGNYIWFNAVVNNVKNLGSGQVKLYLTDSTISFTANGTPYTVQVPNAVVTFNSASQASGAKTTYDLTNNRWNTAVAPTGLTGNTFVTGLAFQVPSNFPTGIQNVTWSAAFTTDSPGVTLQWQWGAAVYSSFSTTYATSPSNSNVLGVNAEDGSADTNGMASCGTPPCTDPAGTPETYKASVIFGASGGGLTNYTGYFSPAAGVVPTTAPMSVSPSSLNFGTQSQGTTTATPLTAIVTDNDSVSYTISSITITGTNAGDFALVPNGPSTPNNCLATSSLASGGSCTLYVTFTPNESGTVTAKIVVNDGANNSPQTVYLSGTGH